MKIITKVAAIAITATIALGIGVSPAQAATRVEKRGLVITAESMNPTGPVTSMKVQKKSGGKWRTISTKHRYKFRKPGKFRVIVTYGTTVTRQTLIPVNYVGSVECRVADEQLISDRTQPYFGYLDGQIDVRYSGTCTGVAYDAEFNAHPVQWSDQWDSTEYVFAKEGTDVLAHNRNRIGDVDFVVSILDLRNVPNAIPGTVAEVSSGSASYAFRIR